MQGIPEPAVDRVAAHDDCRHGRRISRCSLLHRLRGHHCPAALGAKDEPPAAAILNMVATCVRLPECNDGRIFDNFAMAGQRYFDSLEELPVFTSRNFYNGHLEKFFSPSPHESDSVTARDNGRMERASHGAEGLFRC